ncbi:MAG: CCA tRNA nucleotidyltransferase [Deltaproteobacteria bacterium]|nr:CCA tRNA nucleotidyltransferase [Deltaproteobacteria bacterium]
MTRVLAKKVPAYVRSLVKFLWRHGIIAYPVGGGVRDLLLGRDAPEWDLAASASPDTLMSALPKTVPTGLKHGTVTALWEKRSLEITSFRTESAYSDGRRPDEVRFGVTLEEDLSRRDFTINAMAIDLRAGRIVDPFGGRRDLARRLIRCVGDPRLRFSEDGLRPLRAIRFATVLGFAIHPATRRAIQKTIEILKKVSAERVRDEIQKMLLAPRPSRGFEIMRRTGLLFEVLPEVLEGAGVRQNRWHRHDVYRHGLRALDESKGPPLLRLAVLLHDVAKPRCIGGEGPDHTFYGHDKASAAMAEEILMRLRFSKRETETVSSLIAHHMYFYSPEWRDGTVRRFVSRVGPDLVPQILELQRADIIAHGVGKKAALARLEMLARRIEVLSRKTMALKTTDLAVNGNNVMRALRIGPGPRVGAVLSGLLDRVMDNPSLNTRKALLDLIRKER